MPLQSSFCRGVCLVNWQVAQLQNGVSLLLFLRHVSVVTRLCNFNFLKLFWKFPYLRNRTGAPYSESTTSNEGKKPVLIFSMEVPEKYREAFPLLNTCCFKYLGDSKSI